jgi:hypothetical protein
MANKFMPDSEARETSFAYVAAAATIAKNNIALA